MNNTVPRHTKLLHSLLLPPRPLGVLPLPLPRKGALEALLLRSVKKGYMGLKGFEPSRVVEYIDKSDRSEEGGKHMCVCQ